MCLEVDLEEKAREIQEGKEIRKKK